MFLLRLAFWLGLIVLLLPSDEHQQAQLYSNAVATVERVTTFCDRNPETCTAGAEFWATFAKQAEFGARVAIDLVKSGVRREEAAPVPTPVSAEAERIRAMPELRPELRREPRPQRAPRGTLTPADLTPAWRGQPQRTGI